MDFKPLVTLLAIVNPLAIVPFFIHYTPVSYTHLTLPTSDLV